MRNAILIAILLVPLSYAQEPEITYRSTAVTDGIYVLEGVGGFGGGNVGLLVGEQHIVMIDDTMAPTAPALLAVADAAAGRPIDFVINTHVHGDHLGGNALLADTGAVIVAHDNIRKRLLADPSPAGGAAGLPVITFADGMTFHVNDYEAHVAHVERAHTDGDAIIHFKNANVIHAGDLMFNGMFPFIDLDRGGTVDGYIAGAQKIYGIADDDTRIIAGHGPLATKADLGVFIEMLVDARARVQALVLAGKSEDQIVAENPLASYHDEWSWNFITTERMTRTLVRSLSTD